jgi:hypothetical protein
MSTIVHVTSSSDPTLVVFGRDGAGKPRASWFDAVSAELATKAAALMKMRVLRIETEEQRNLARQLAPGRVFASGRALLPFAGTTVFDKLVELARGTSAKAVEGPKASASPTKGNSGPSAHAEPLRLVHQAAGPGPGYSASAATSPRPQDWSEIGLASLVLAFDPSFDAWFEAFVIAENGDMLTLRWRDYPHEGTVQRRPTQLALLPPEKP